MKFHFKSVFVKKYNGVYECYGMKNGDFLFTRLNRKGERLVMHRNNRITLTRARLMKGLKNCSITVRL